MTSASALTLAAEGIRLRVRVKPGSSPPEEGKANAALAALLSKAWGIPKTSIQVRVGANGRSKILEIDGDPATLGPRLRLWLDSLAEI